VSVELNIESLVDVFSETLAESKAILDLAAETQANGKWQVFQGFDFSDEHNESPTPSLIIVPNAEDEASDLTKTLSILMELRLRDNRVTPAVSPHLARHSAPGVAMRWTRTVRSVLKNRVKGTDAKSLYLSTQYDFTSFAKTNLVAILFTATVPLSKNLGHRSLCI